MAYGGERPGTGPLFRLAWRGSHHPGRPVEDQWIALDGDADGGWWFDAYFLGCLPLGQGRRGPPSSPGGSLRRRRQARTSGSSR